MPDGRQNPGPLQQAGAGPAQLPPCRPGAMPPAPPRMGVPPMGVPPGGMPAASGRAAPTSTATLAAIRGVAATANALIDEVSKAIIGKRNVLEDVLI